MAKPDDSLDSKEYIQQLINKGQLEKAASVLACEMHHQFQTGDIDGAMAVIDECLPDDQFTRDRLLELLPNIQVK